MPAPRDADVGEAEAPEERAPKRRSKRPVGLLIAVVVVVIAVWGYREWKLRKKHTVTYRALSDATCRVRVEYGPSPSVDPLVKQVGIVTPWQVDAQLTQEREATLQVFGDASCGAIRCELAVDGVVISRKTMSTKDDLGVNSASCRALAVDVGRDR